MSFAGKRYDFRDQAGDYAQLAEELAGLLSGESDFVANAANTTALALVDRVASALAESEIASEIYSTAGEFDILAKFYVESDVDIGHFVGERVQTIPGIVDTRTIITFRAF